MIILVRVNVIDQRMRPQDVDAYKIKRKRLKRSAPRGWGERSKVESLDNWGDADASKKI